MKPIGSLSLDLDNKWAYLRAAGRSHWEGCQSYFPLVVPRIVDLVGQTNLPLTVFLVGRDL
ncbi:MAG: chitooligosaccharide deacetylase, partial [Planctomycetota bacterium]